MFFQGGIFRFQPFVFGGVPSGKNPSVVTFPTSPDVKPAGDQLETGVSGFGGFGVVGADWMLQKQMLHRKYLHKFDRSKLIIVLKDFNDFYLERCSVFPTKTLKVFLRFFLGEFKDCCHYPTRVNDGVASVASV